jgi:hypothetical protein
MMRIILESNTKGTVDTTIVETELGYEVELYINNELQKVHQCHDKSIHWAREVADHLMESSF